MAYCKEAVIGDNGGGWESGERGEMGGYDGFPKVVRGHGM